MSPESFFQENREEICHRWQKKVLASYSDKTSRFYSRDKNPFSNPVGNQLRNAISSTIQHLSESDNQTKLPAAVTEFIKIRAVQDFKPSEAVGFFFQLKEVLRDLLKDQPYGNRLDEDWIRVESKIDRLVCLTFDYFVESRQKIYEIRINEIKRTGYRLLKKAQIIDPDQDIDPHVIGGSQ
jgi:hypothetical protein